jgi:hypothetical protein
VLLSRRNKISPLPEFARRQDVCCEHDIAADRSESDLGLEDVVLLK